MIRRKPAGVLAVSRLHLQCGMGDPEPAVQFMGDVVQQAIVEPCARAHEMRCHGGFGGAHRPDVKIVNFSNSGTRFEILPDGLGPDRGRPEPL